jgi:YVTN family beta-propeller protein
MFPSIFRFALVLLLLVAMPAMASRYAYIPRAGTNTVAVIDTQTNALLTNITLPTGGQPWSVAVHPSGHRVYVARGNGNTVAVIDTSNNCRWAAAPTTWPCRRMVPRCGRRPMPATT